MTRLFYKCDDCGEPTYPPFEKPNENPMISYCRCVDREESSKKKWSMKVEYRMEADFIPEYITGEENE